MNELINLGNGQFVKVTMLKGEKGSNIATITKTGTSGLVDTYTVTLTDGSTTTFEVKNGKTIVSVVKTGTSGLVDTYTITYNDNTTSTFTVTNGRGIERIDKTWTSGLVDTYTITYNDGTTSTFDVTNGNAESLQDAIKASSCAIKAGVGQVIFTQLGSAYITYIPNSECVENAIVVVCFDNGSMYKGTLNYSSTAGRWGISDVSLIQGSDVPATWNVGYGNDSVGTRAFRTGTDFVFSSGVGIALSTSSDVMSYYCVLSSGKVSDNYLQTQIDEKQNQTDNALNTTAKTVVGAINELLGKTQISDLKSISSSYTWSNLFYDIKHSEKPIYFTNWNDNTNFPFIYGSGIGIRGLDANNVNIIYTSAVSGVCAIYSHSSQIPNGEWNTLNKWNMKIAVSLPSDAQWHSYTAPYDGEMWIRAYAKQHNNGTAVAQIGSAGFYFRLAYDFSAPDGYNDANNAKVTIIPMKKGKTLYMYAESNVVVTDCHFTY